MRYLTLVLLAAALTGTSVRAQTPVSVQQTLAPSEQKLFEPGYAMGDIAIGDPKVADYKVMGADRRSLMLLGRGVGTTTLTSWDQQRRQRHQVLIAVIRPEVAKLESELAMLLQDFPSVEVRKLGTSLVLVGSVSSKNDLTVVQTIAAAAKVSSVVRYVPPIAPGGSDPAPPPPPVAPPVIATPSPAPATTARLTTPDVPSPSPAAPAVPAAAAPTTATPQGGVVYDIELLEASIRFRTGSYATGIEPSGRSIFRGMLEAPINQTSQIFIGGPALVGAPGTSKKNAPKPAMIETGIRLHVTPEAADPAGKFKSRVMVETNLPIGSRLYDPEAWRRSRMEFSARSGEPFAITGTDLLATPEISTNEKSRLGTATSTAGRVDSLPGVDVPGLSSVPIFGSLFGSRQYREQTTQLLVILRPVVKKPQR